MLARAVHFPSKARGLKDLAAGALEGPVLIVAGDGEGRAGPERRRLLEATLKELPGSGGRGILQERREIEEVLGADGEPRGAVAEALASLVGEQKLQAILRIRDEVSRACRDFFNAQGFVLVDTPILTPTACEGTTSLFETNYLDRGKAYLSQSGQLYLEAAAMALGKVYCFGPTFRAENSHTSRHRTA